MFGWVSSFSSVVCAHYTYVMCGLGTVVYLCQHGELPPTLQFSYSTSTYDAIICTAQPRYSTSIKQLPTGTVYKHSYIIEFTTRYANRVLLDYEVYTYGTFYCMYCTTYST